MFDETYPVVAHCGNSSCGRGTFLVRSTWNEWSGLPHQNTFHARLQGIKHGIGMWKASTRCMAGGNFVCNHTQITNNRWTIVWMHPKYISYLVTCLIQKWTECMHDKVFYSCEQLFVISQRCLKHLYLKNAHILLWDARKSKMGHELYF